MVNCTSLIKSTQTVIDLFYAERKLGTWMDNVMASCYVQSYVWFQPGKDEFWSSLFSLNYTSPHLVYLNPPRPPHFFLPIPNWLLSLKIIIWSIGIIYFFCPRLQTTRCVHPLYVSCCLSASWWWRLSLYPWKKVRSEEEETEAKLTSASDDQPAGLAIEWSWFGFWSRSLSWTKHCCDRALLPKEYK